MGDAADDYPSAAAFRARHITGLAKGVARVSAQMGALMKGLS
jgi:hypothetical protein